MRTLFLLLIVLATGGLATPGRAEIADYGSFTYELYQQLQENHTPQPPPLAPSHTPIFHCQATSPHGLACQDDRHRRYHCKDHGATGHYCQREDGQAWIHCFRRLLGRYKCAVISARLP